MLYDTLKIVHILSATILLAGVATCVRCWAGADAQTASDKIQAKTVSIIIPFALLQLLTGFTMISLDHYALSDFWIKGSLLGFVLAIGSWFAFLLVRNRLVQKILLSICLTVIACMIFLMANKV
jgi:uncharacterized membrane protein